MILLFNKPFNVLCQFTDTSGRKTLADYISEKGLYPAGRLDRDSEGLVILTDNGKLQGMISHPRYKLEKRYQVQVEGIPDDEQLQTLRTGVRLKDGLTLPASIAKIAEPPVWQRDPPVRYRAKIPTSWLELTIREGKNRQVRRMTASVGHPTLRLIRSAVGPLELGDLHPGESREIDLKCLLENPQLPPEWRKISADLLQSGDPTPAKQQRRTGRKKHPRR